MIIPLMHKVGFTCTVQCTISTSTCFKNKYSDVSTGPDPFPFRAPRQDRVNQLVEYYNQYLRTAAHKQGIEFSLDDFLLQHGGEMFDDLNEQLNGKQHNVSNQNYLITYQRYG